MIIMEGKGKDNENLKSPQKSNDINMNANKWQ